MPQNAGSLGIVTVPGRQPGTGVGRRRLGLAAVTIEKDLPAAGGLTTDAPEFPPAGLVERIQAQGFNARLVTYSGGDHRLRVTGGPSDPAVELLGPCGALRSGPRWQAVRQDGNGRTVWEGPACDEWVTRAAVFVEHLMALGPNALAKRYRLVGART